MKKFSSISTGGLYFITCSLFIMASACNRMNRQQNESGSTTNQNQQTTNEGSAPSSDMGTSTADTNAPTTSYRVTLLSRSKSNVTGDLTFQPVGDSGLRVLGTIRNLTPGAHGFHIHEKGDCSAEDASSAGNHYQASGQTHGAKDATSAHLGDLGNITADAQGVATIDVTTTRLCLRSGEECSVIGKSVVVHADPDDLTTDPSGKSGARLACGVIK